MGLGSSATTTGASGGATVGVDGGAGVAAGCGGDEHAPAQSTTVIAMDRERLVLRTIFTIGSSDRGHGGRYEKALKGHYSRGPSMYMRLE